MLYKEREESLFWAYELYWSGFKDETWHWLREIYVKFYENANPRFKCRLDEFYLNWHQTGDNGLIGTAVGTLAMRSREADQEERLFVLNYSDARHETIPASSPPRKYLLQVSQWPIRPSAVQISENQGLPVGIVRDAYLDMNWLYYCSGSPIWLERIKAFNGVVMDCDKSVAFVSEDDYEAFYELWGLEPDEQSREMHLWHGVSLDDDCNSEIIE